MARTIVICGHGPGISDAVARKFGGEGFQVALVGRNAERLRAGAEALQAKGIRAEAFAGDLADTAKVRELFASIKAQLGAVTVIHWNAYGGAAGDLTTCDPAELGEVFDLSVTSLVVAMQQALPDMKAQDGAAILVTGGGIGFHRPEIDKMAVSWGAMGLAVGKSAQHKLVGVLHHRLASDGVYVGEVVVLGTVKGTAFDRGNGTLEPTAIANRFWEMYTTRDRSTTDFTG